MFYQYINRVIVSRVVLINYRYLNEIGVCIYYQINMSKETERDEMKEESHELQDNEQEELDEIEEEEEEELEDTEVE
jgi:hypothetical protein